MWRSVSRYHERVGYTLMPNVAVRVPFEKSGYLLKTNAAGFRSAREFVKEPTPAEFRLLLFGDSQTAGDGVSNGDRYSDVLESLCPGVAVYNYGLPGTGTDQQYLAYLDCAAGVSHDLLVIGMYVENIGRVAHRFRPFFDADGKEVIYAKPYYKLENGELVLGHVPVPKAPWTRQTLPPTESAHVDWGAPHAGLRDVVKKLGMRDLMQKITRFQPVPQYDSPSDPAWLLLRRILEMWIRGSSRPVLLLLLPMWPFIEESSDPTNYLARFKELAADTGCLVHDPLPDLWKYSPEERRAFRFKVDTHYTKAGHAAIARSLQPVIEGLMRKTESTVKVSL